MHAFTETMKMIKVEHSIFAFPFALSAAFLAAGGLPQLRLLVLIVLACVLARSSAMAFNRWLDRDIDRANPRTAMRAIPAGSLSKNYALGFTLITGVFFIVVACFINELVALAAPLMLMVLWGYSACKRFTNYSHLVLGVALSLAPLGAWLAIRGSVSTIPLLLCGAVVCWVGGFDILYAGQDLDFDRQQRLHSIPARWGNKGAWRFARVLHCLVLVFLLALAAELAFNPLFLLGVVAMVACLAYEHFLVWDGDLSRINQAFFLMNGLAGLAFGTCTILATVI